jgi:hypothetical protein
MLSLRLALAAPALLLGSPLASATQQVDPLRFFDGRTVTEGTVKILFHRPYHSRGIGIGRIENDGSLTLVQQIEDEGKPAHERRWRVWRKGHDSFTASMTQAIGPVTIDKVGDDYRFRFKMKGHLSAEEMVTPLADGRSARSSLKVRRFGVVVATTTGTIRKI